MTKNNNIRRKIGDKVNFRIRMKIFNVDLLNGEVASGTSSAKYFHDNREILRETKSIADQFCRSRFSANSKKMKIKACSIKIAGTEGGIVEVSLVDDGLYLNNHLGSLRWPIGVAEFDAIRTLICRLLEVRV